MTCVRRALVLNLVPALFALQLLAQEPDYSARIFVTGGFISSPTDFDVARSVDYGSGFRIGGGAALQLYEHVSVRADVSAAFGSGTDTTGGISEDASLDRLYIGVGIEYAFQPEEPAVPYLFGGGGMVSIDRKGASATSYAFDITEFTGLIGAGVRYGFAPNVHAFVEGTGWVYNRAADDSAQFDTSVGVGIGYRFGS